MKLDVLCKRTLRQKTCWCKSLRLIRNKRMIGKANIARNHPGSGYSHIDTDYMYYRLRDFIYLIQHP